MKPEGREPADRPFLGYRCTLCGAEHEAEPLLYRCPRDGGVLEVVVDLARVRRRGLWGLSPERSMWRYLPLLPVRGPGGRGSPLAAVGATPLFAPARLRRDRGLPFLWLKDESRNPTASFKDRASALVTVRAGEIGASTLVTASTGNAGVALAGMAAAAGRQAVVLAPRAIPEGKLAQLLAYGALAILVEGSYDAAVRLSQAAAEELGWYCRNTAHNPFTAEGKKSAAFEIWEELLAPGGGAAGRPPAQPHRGAGRRPLAVFVPVGDGNIMAGLHKGFRELSELGWLERMPRLFGVQAEGSSVVAAAFRRGTERLEPARASTVADSLAVDSPADGLRALRAVRETGGCFLTVSDREILQAIPALGAHGVFAEPAAAAAWAGLERALETGLVGKEDPCLVLVTGSGLKDPRAARRAAAEPPVIEPTLPALRKAVSGRLPAPRPA